MYMFEVYPRLFVADDSYCVSGTPDMAVVHACKSPCHKEAVGYTGSLPKDHDNYLVLESEWDLYLNMIDPMEPLFMPETFSSAMHFINKHYTNGREVLIHCNRGESRSGSLALLFLAKYLHKISDVDYWSAKDEFEELYYKYNPNDGIQIYLDMNWNTINM